MAEKDAVALPERGAPLVATGWRWAGATALCVSAAVAMARTYLALLHSERSLASLSPTVIGACTLASALLWATLRAEEVRLARELRLARTGTSLGRAMVAHRRQRASLLGRLTTAKLGIAAVLLADDDRSGALDALSGGSPLMRGGRLERLRAVVQADADRAGAEGGALDLCVQGLRAMWRAGRIGNREADLYRTHVLVKTLLEQGDAQGALDLARDLRSSRDEEERVYLAWLRVWFDLDLDAEVEGSDEAWPPLSEGEIRMATLLARAHGAEKLVEKLDARLAAIARTKEGE